jgi:hypothetical protein
MSRFHAQVRGCARGMALAGIVAGGLLLMPTLADAAPRDRKVAQPAAPAGASGASSPAGAQPRVSPYALAARRQAQAASGAGHAPAVPPSMRRTRRAISRVPSR